MSVSPVKVHAIIGTKAQLIKMAPVLQEFQRQNIAYNFVLTGQHEETLDDLRKNFNLKDPDHALAPVTDITGVGQMFLWALRILWNGFRKRKEFFGSVDKTHLFLVHGDTVSTVIGALLGRLVGAQVAHIESGLRSFNYFHPFPEELSRVITFFLSHYYFCPGEWAVKNLKNFSGEKINTECNTLYDALGVAVKNAEKKERSSHIPEGQYAVCTLHRFENIFRSTRFQEIIHSIQEVATQIPVLFILHPPTRKQLLREGLFEALENTEGIELRPRYDYLQFIELLHYAEFVISDGGSNQEECFYLGKPCLLIRDCTERSEGIGANVVLSHYQTEKIRAFVKDYKKYRSSAFSISTSPSAKIVKFVAQKTSVEKISL